MGLGKSVTCPGHVYKQSGWIDSHTLQLWLGWDSGNLHYGGRVQAPIYEEHGKEKKREELPNTNHEMRTHSLINRELCYGAPHDPLTFLSSMWGLQLEMRLGRGHRVKTILILCGDIPSISCRASFSCDNVFQIFYFFLHHLYLSD